MTYHKIDDRFHGIARFLLNMPKVFYNGGEILENKRNIVKKLETTEGTLVVKNFKGMYFFNRLGYSLFSDSKAKKSYNNAKTLQNKGFITPENVGWLDTYRMGLLQESYYVSVFSPFRTMKEMLQDVGNDISKKNFLYQQFISFVVRLHSKGVFHDDFSITNVLVIPEQTGFKFSMIDLNRVYFKKVDYETGLKNFNKLDLPEDELNALIREYAQQSGMPPEESVTRFWANKRKAHALREFRRSIRRHTLTPIEKFFKIGRS